MFAGYRWLPRIVAALAVMTPAVLVASAGPEWNLVPLPGGRAGLLPRLGLSPDMPAALTLGEVIRVVHASRDFPNPALAAARTYFAAPAATPSEPIPIPLKLTQWRDFLGSDVDDDTLIANLLQDRRASMLCYGLLQLDRETAAFVAGDRVLLRRIYENHTGAFAAFGDVVRVRQGQLVLPGGQSAAPAWAEMIGEPLTNTSRAVAALLGADNGRLAYFAKALEDLDETHLAAVFAQGEDDEDRLDRTRGIYHAFTGVEPGWRLVDFPFVRLGADPALLLGSLRTTADGQLRHTRDFWEVALGDRSLPDDANQRWAELGLGDRAEAGWLLRRLTDAPLPTRIERALVYQFAERLTDRLPDASVADVAWLTRAYRRFPALLLTLERLDVSDTAVLKRLTTHASLLTTVADDTAALEIGYALFQAPLMLLTQARQVHALDQARAHALVASLSAIEPAKVGYGRAIARWLETELLPALGHDPSIEGTTAEGGMLEGLAGLRVPASGAAPRALTWEARAYRIDVAAPEVARLSDVRGLQGGNTLDTALALSRVGHALEAATTVDAARAAATTLGELKAAVQPIEASERTTAASPPDVPSLVEQAFRDVSRVRARGDVKRLESIAGRLSRAEDAVLADVLTSLLYALWLGDPGGSAFLAGSVSRRHDFGVRLITGADREETPWRLPLETSGDGEPWHVRGALLGLDIGLARLALHRTKLDLPDDQPSLNESDRRTLMTSLVLTDVADLDDATAARMAGWLREGRAIARAPERLVAALDGLGLDGRRRQAVLWASAHTPDAVPALLMRTELVLLGRERAAEVPAAWGAAQTPRTGCLCLAFPDPPAVHRYIGRAGTGLLSSRMADIKLRVLEILDEKQLPAALTRGVLASALQDYLDDVRPVHGDDWWTLARYLDRVAPERFDDYISALTAGGPLVPLDGAAPTANGHE